MANNARNGDTTETRKVQVSGNSTFLITLPKKWVEKVKLRSSDSIALVPLSNGTLLINPIKMIDTKLNRFEEDQPIKTINIQSQGYEVLWRKFIGAYLVGYNIVRFRSKKTLSKSDRMMIKKISNSVMGTEIISETGNSVTVRDLLGKGGFSIVQGVQRMHLMAKSMHNDAIRALKIGDIDLMEDVEARDEEIDKFHWMVAKQYNFISRDVYFADKMGIAPQEALGHLLVARSIEKIADHATRIAYNGRKISKKHKLVDTIVSLNQETLDLFDKSMEAFFMNDFNFADRVVRDSLELNNRLNSLEGEILKLRENPSISIPLAYICDSLERSVSYSKDIAEIAINHLFVADIQKKSAEAVSSGGGWY
jgi:phosphate uptake regulator